MHSSNTLLYSEANELDLMREGFVWIVTDAITGSPYEMSYSGYYPSFYKGRLGSDVSLILEKSKVWQ